MKRTLITFIIFLLAASFAVGALAYEVPSDVAGTDYEVPVSVLMPLGIVTGYPDGTYRPENEITRAEFCALMIRTLSLEEVMVGLNHQSVFSDVDQDHWAYGHISVAYDLGLINGFPDGTFRPDENITGEQAVKIAVNMLGYEPVALEEGGYPNGYIEVGADVGLFKGLPTLSYENMKRGYTARLIYNALYINLMEKTSNGSYSVSDDKTLLLKRLDYLGIEQKSGIVTANELTDLYSDKRMRKGDIEIDSVRYQAGDIDTTELLGYRVTYYAHKESGVLLSVVKDINENETFTIKHSDINTVALPEISYFEGNKIKRERVPTGIPVVYNGKRWYGYTDEDLHIVSGNITLLDNNDDGEYDILFVNTHTNYMVDEVDAENSRVVIKPFSDNGESRFGGRSYIDFADSTISLYLYDAEGNEMAFTDLQRNQLLSAYTSKDQAYAKFFAVDEKITGTVEEVGSDGEVVIDGVNYRRARNEKKEYLLNMKLGESGEYWLDLEGEIAAKRTVSSEDVPAKAKSELTYGYVEAVAVSGPFGANVQFKMLLKLSDGTQKIKIYDLDNTVTVNGYSKDAAEALEIVSPGEEFVPCLIGFELDGEDHIKSITTLEQMIPPDYRIYSSKTKAFDNMYYILDENLVFLVDVDNEDSLYDLKIDLANGMNYYVEIYENEVDQDTTDRIYVAHTTIEYANKKMPDTSNPVFVEKLTSFLDEETGSARYRMYAFSGKEAVSLMLSDDMDASGIETGTVMYISVDSNGEVYDYKKVADLPVTESYRLGIGGKTERISGTVLSLEQNADESSVILTVEFKQYGQTKSAAYEIAGKPIYAFNKSTNTVELGTLDDIAEGEWIFLSINNLDVAMVIVY